MNNSSATAGLSAANNIQKPKRPLSAFNLFYRYKRQHIIRLITSNPEGSVDKDTIRHLFKTPPGLEYNYTLVVASVASTQAEIDALRRHHICIELKNLQARDLKTRAHRKSMNCPIGFVELSKLMNSSWKDCDDVAKAVFNELSQEIREVYHRKIREYNDMCKALGLTKQKQAKKESKKRSRISVDESDDTSNEPDNKKAKLTKKEKAEAEVIHQPPKFPPPLHVPRVSPVDEVADQQEAANAMLLLGTAATKKQNGPLKKRPVHTTSLLNNPGSTSSAFHHPPPSQSGIVPSVQLDDFVTGSWKINPPPRSLAQLNQSSQMTRQACVDNGDVFTRSYNSSSLLQQYMSREIERIQGRGRS